MVEMLEFVVVVVAAPFVVVVSVAGCVQLETPKAASSVATMKVMLKRRAVQKRRG
jgi:hypothetical protein